MPTIGVSMRKIKSILRLHFEAKLSQHQIANSVQLSAGAVNKYIKRAIRAGLSWPLSTEYEDEGKLQALLKSTGSKETIKRPKLEIDFTYIHQELQPKGVTLQLLWEEHRQTIARLISYNHFCLLYRSWKKTQPQSMRQPQACVEEIDYQHPRELQKSQFVSLITCEFIRQRFNLIITGSTGCGKSYLACAIGHQACVLGFNVKYLRSPRFLEELKIAHADGSYGKLLVQTLKADLLILDDFGLEPAFTSEQRRDVFNIIEDRHQLKSTLITSQKPVKHWHDYIGEPTTADAMLDRLLEKSHRIELKGPSMRNKK